MKNVFKASCTLLLLMSLALLSSGCCKTKKTHAPLVLMTDFGLQDGAVSAMKGVAYQVSPQLLVSDLTHDIPAYDIWQAAYRLKQTAPYWPSSSVFVTVVDPGVGSQRRSIVARTQSGQLFVGPDNGHLTLISEIDPVVEVRNIDESQMRLQGSQESYTFHGRDLYVYIGAQLASRKLDFKNVGPQLESPLHHIKYQKPTFEDGVLKGNIPVLDPKFGNVWSNIPKAKVTEHFSNLKDFNVKIKNKNTIVYEARLPLGDTFASVALGHPLLYFNSLLDLSVALNQDSFAKKHQVQSGADWSIEISK